MEVCQTKLDDLLPLRQKYLLPDWELERLRFPGDEDPDTLHLGAWDLGELIGVVSFLKQPLPESEHSDASRHFRLRQMAVADSHRRRGVGRQLVEAGLAHLGQKGCPMVWCHARRVAYAFYASCGFRYFGKEFEIEGVGPHTIMTFALSREPRQDEAREGHQ